MPTAPTEFSLDKQKKILRATNEWEQTFDAVSDLIFIVDTDLNIVRVNRATSDRCGCTPQELVGRKCFEVMHGSAATPDGCPYGVQFENGIKQTFESQIDSLDGYFEVTISPLKNEKGKVVANVHVARDITEKKRREELLAEQQKQLEEINSTLETRIESTLAELRRKDEIIIQQGRLSAMSEMISSIAHQWRQPLNNIGLIIQSMQIAFIQNDLSADEMNSAVNNTMNILQQISKTIDEFRYFFSSEKEASVFFVDKLITRSLTFIGPSLKNSDIRIEFDQQPALQIMGYPNEYMQVILNIILNARDAFLEHQTQNPIIRIAITEDDGHSSVIISDNGGGICEDILPKIFDPYFTTRHRKNASGIGLYMAKMIIEKKMHGSLTACNRECGAEFRIVV
ncbi:MAG TPA: PAS domain-containing sensor histidine kinase [Desulfuromonadales bacterium]|nr:PAS domain-containing sensor histidine kinase [Desulfuromonadales bacterium]